MLLIAGSVLLSPDSMVGVKVVSERLLWAKTREPELLRTFSLLVAAFLVAGLISLRFPGEGK